MALSDLEARFEALQALGQHLNEVSDALKEELKIVEAKLASFNIGLEVEYAGRPLYQREVVEIPDDNDQERIVGTAQKIGYLAYGKTEREGWGILVKHYVRREDFNSGKTGRFVDPFQPVQLLRNASRDLRLAAADLLPALLDEITRKGQAKIVAIRKVTDRK
jgi:hypothetical protein